MDAEIEQNQAPASERREKAEDLDEPWPRAYVSNATSSSFRVLAPGEDPTSQLPGREWASPKFVYHYTSWKSLRKIAETRGLLMNTFPKLNDPRESKKWEVGFYGTGKPSVRPEGVSEVVERFKANIRVLSCSMGSPDELTNSDRSGHGYAKPAMWAHYGENHSGACLVLDRKKLQSCIERAFANSMAPGGRLSAGDVHYASDSLQDASFQGISLNEIASHTVDAAIEEHLLRHWDGIFFVKHADWSPEVEYRWVAYDPARLATDIVDITGALQSLILGAEFPTDEVSTMYELAHLTGTGSLMVQHCSWDRMIANIEPVEVSEERLKYVQLPRLIATVHNSKAPTAGPESPPAIQ
jgi:hypothetical protein